jgi:hypothetical protein
VSQFGGEPLVLDDDVVVLDDDAPVLEAVLVLEDDALVLADPLKLVVEALVVTVLVVAPPVPVPDAAFTATLPPQTLRGAETLQQRRGTAGRASPRGSGALRAAVGRHHAVLAARAVAVALADAMGSAVDRAAAVVADAVPVARTGRADLAAAGAARAARTEPNHHRYSAKKALHVVSPRQAEWPRLALTTGLPRGCPLLHRAVDARPAERHERDDALGRLRVANRLSVCGLLAAVP